MHFHSLTEAYEAYRRVKHDGWGLAWYLSAELCKRYYSSHGIIPYVSEHEGLGYYGIELHLSQCPVHGQKEHRLGRLTMAGDIERWAVGSPGHSVGHPLFDRARRGESLSILLQEAIRHLLLPPIPQEQHNHCRHKRRGQSFVLLYEVAALLAIQYEGRLKIWNHPFHTEPFSRELEVPAKIGGKEPHRYFLFDRHEATLLLRDDGHVVVPHGAESLWERHMRGESAADLARWVANQLHLNQY